MGGYTGTICGHRVSMKGVQRCRPCRNAFYTQKHCAECGADVQRAATLCRACYDKSREAIRPLCVDCGQPTKRYAYEYAAKRCWSCEVKRRRANPERKCSAEGCDRRHSAHGLCKNHYTAQRQRQLGAHRGGSLSRKLALWPCQKCGYSRMKSTVHRLIPGSEHGRYVPGNMVALCVRCHAEIHRGIELPPVPPTAMEIEAVWRDRDVPSPMFSKAGFIGIFEDGQLVNGSPEGPVSGWRVPPFGQ